jgi:hypothetical protein
MSQQKLDMIQLTTSLMAQTCTGPAKIARSEGRNLAGLCLLLHDAPNYLGAEARSPNSAGLVNRAK